MYFALERREVNNDDFRDDRRENFRFSEKAFIVKWAVIGGITLFFLLWFVGGYIHARRRVRKGLKPLLYHRFLLPYHRRPQAEPQNAFSFYRQEDQGYQMDPYGPPPPVYNPDQPMPPHYMPPRGGTKANPSQEWIAPPPGAPPDTTINTSPDRPPADEEAGVKPGDRPDHFAKLKHSIL